MAAEPHPIPWPPNPLPRGRHGLTAADVSDSQRERLLRAMLELVAQRGYAAAAIADVAARARVSPNRFYALFDSKAACFLEVCDRGGRELLAELESLAALPTWRAALEEGMRRYLSWWRDRPELSRAYFVELPRAGEEALVRRDELFDGFVAMFEALAARARAEEHDVAAPSRLALRLLVAGMTELVGEQVRRGRLSRLGTLHGELVELVASILARPAA